MQTALESVFANAALILDELQSIDLRPYVTFIAC